MAGTQIVTTNDNKPLPESDENRMALNDYRHNSGELVADIEQFAKAHTVSFGRAQGHLVGGDEEFDSLTDAQKNLALLQASGVAVRDDEFGASTRTATIYDKPGLAAMFKQYIQDQYYYGVHTPRLMAIGQDVIQLPKLQAAENTRSSLPGTSFNIQTVGELEMPDVLIQDIEIADIIGARTETRNNRYVAPRVDPPEDYKNLIDIGEGGTIPTWKMGEGDVETRLKKSGYGIPMTYELLRSSDLTIQELAEFTMWMAFETNALQVNYGLNLALTNPKKTDTPEEFFALRTLPYSGKLERRDVMDMTIEAKRTSKAINWNMMVGDKTFLLDYADVDLFQNSASQFPMTPMMRDFYDAFRGMQRIRWRESEDVENLTGGARATALLMDTRFVLRYLMERNAMIEETDRDPSVQIETFYNTFSWNFCFLHTADIARAKVEVATSQ